MNTGNIASIQNCTTCGQVKDGVCIYRGRIRENDTDVLCGCFTPIKNN